jgi:hypothetical protein
MTTRGQAAFLEIGDGFGSITNRWQSYWIDQIVSWDSQSWTYQQLDWAGLISGQAVGDQATITLPAVPSVLQLTERALAGAWVAQLRVIQWDEELSSTPPASGYVLAASCVGQVIGATGSLTQVTWRLGSALSPLGAQFPPRTAITALIGVPCRL